MKVDKAHDNSNHVVSSEPYKVEITLLIDRNVKQSTSKVILEVIPEWSPLGAEHFKKLIKSNFYDNCRIFRVIPNFMNQFGISGKPGGGREWKEPIADDPNRSDLSGGNIEGTISFAMSGKNSRTTQLFINTGKNSFLDKQGFTPFGHVIEGMEHWKTVNSQYREKPDQGKIRQQGNNYLDDNFPHLSSIVSIRIV